MTDEITRSQLATLLDDEGRVTFAERIRAGADPETVMTDGYGQVTKALRKSRYDGSAAPRAREIAREHHAIFTGIANGTLVVVEDAR